MRLAIFWAALISASLLTYAHWVEPQWIETTEHRISDSNLGDIKIVQLTDLHLDGNLDYQSNIIEIVNSQNPALIVLSGDVIDDKANLNILDDFLQQLPATNIIATLGNWEYWADIDLDALTRIYERNGVRLLVNQEKTFEIQSRRLRVIGLDDFTAGKPAFDTFRATPLGTISLIIEHSPGLFGDLMYSVKKQPLTADLCLAGHTHGGQITLFGQLLWTPPGSGRFAEGFYQTDRCPLYVSRGVGTSLLPLRFGARPEIAVFYL